MPNPPLCPNGPAHVAHEAERGVEWEGRLNAQSSKSQSDPADCLNSPSLMPVMLRLTTFGGVSIARDDVVVTGSVTAWRRRALLALLAVHSGRGIHRDTLCSLLWPASETEQARHSLHQLLHSMRKLLRADELFAGTAVLQLNPSCILTDVEEFDSALRGRHFERVVAVYRGPLASDLDFEEAPELERFLGSFRAHYAREHATALEGMARSATMRGDLAGGTKWWQRLAELDQLNGRVAKEYIEALVASGERVRALQFALVHQTLVSEVLETPPDTVITDWIARLRAPGPQPLATGVIVPTRAAHEWRDTPSGVAEEKERERRLAQLTRSVGARYRIGELLTEGRIAATFSVHPLKDAREDLELHALQPRVAAIVRTEVFSSVMARVVGLADAHVLPVFDYGALEHVVYFVSARRMLPTLRQRLRKSGPLPLRDVLCVARDIAVALACAHSRGVRHGDLRPKHVGITQGGAIVADFGILEAVSPEQLAPLSSTVLTFGSPAYQSPEQLSKEVVADARSDVYAFGCVVFEMLVGEPPFGRAGSAAELVRKLTQPPPEIRAHRDRVPEELERIVQTCLQRVAADRFPSGVELAEALGVVQQPVG
jgi:DNA-binding SARP family transcriptional activator